MVNVINLEDINPTPVSEIGEGVILSEVEQIEKHLNSYVHYTSAGTILGLYRDGHLIPHDTDYDIEILDDDYDYDRLNFVLENKCGLRLIRVMKYEGSVMQLAYRMKCGFIFDIYIYYDDDMNTWYNWNDKGMLVVKYNQTPLVNTESYLQHRYGDDWMIPKKSKESWEKDCGDALLRQ